ncbi:MAG: hypothetical protein CK426_02945, partial [Legionella sp.]
DAIDNDIQPAAARQKRLEEWKRQWKIDLIPKMNPDGRGLYHNIIQCMDPAVCAAGIRRWEFIITSS